MAHARDEGCKIRISVRCRALAAERSGGSLAGGGWFAELSSQPVCARELPGLHVWRVLYGRLKGRRIAVYVPEELVPEVRRSLENGRALQDLLQQAAPRYVKALKRERAKATKGKKSRD